MLHVNYETTVLTLPSKSGRLKAQGIHTSWKKLRQALSAWQRVMTTIKDTQGQVIVNVQDERPRAALDQIARICGVTPSLHRQRYVHQD